ncbi:phosphatase PAP2 family protein [Candidatus Dactylopiibacterium carminicum]|nr:phosphatase PAP2 family protein [Candidatus Dactylopiibacterium carminicum]
MRNEPRSGDQWWSRFMSVLCKQFWLKSLGTMGFTAAFFVAYIYLLKNPAYPVTEVPLTWLDRVVPFSPLALVPYLSLWAYVSLPPLFLVNASELISYGLRIGAVCLLGLLIFHFWPTAVPPADIDWARYPGVAFLKGVDAAGNACPSLHVATAVFSAVWLQRLLCESGAPRYLVWVNLLWCGLIVWSTLATRQHVALDAYGGALLGGAGAWLSLLRRRLAPSAV